MGGTIVHGDLPSTVLQWDGPGDSGVKTDVRLDVEVLYIIVEIFGDLGVMRKDGIAVGHRVVRELHTRLRGVDEERFVGTGHAIAVLVHPISTNAVACFVAVERDAILLESFSRGDAG